MTTLSLLVTASAVAMMNISEQHYLSFSSTNQHPLTEGWLTLDSIPYKFPDPNCHAVVAAVAAVAVAFMLPPQFGS